MADQSRAYRDLEDLRAIERAISASWLVARPLVSATVGDVEWWLASAPPDVDWSERIRLWERDGEVIACGWFAGPADLDLFIRADLRPTDRPALIAELTDWLGDRAAWWATEGPHEPPTEPAAFLTTYALDADGVLGGELTAAGFAPDLEPQYSFYHRHLPTSGPEPAPVLPPGYTLRHVRGDGELAARVEVHRAAFAPSRMTAEKYCRLVALDHYAFERDLVVEAPDGSLAAFTMVWWDPVARVGEFEPVGVHPDHRRLGLGRAINLAGVRLLRDLGAIDVIVFSAIANGASEALYRSAGFRRLTIVRPWRRPAA